MVNRYVRTNYMGSARQEFFAELFSKRDLPRRKASGLFFLLSRGHGVMIDRGLGTVVANALSRRADKNDDQRNAADDKGEHRGNEHEQGDKDARRHTRRGDRRKRLGEQESENDVGNQKHCRNEGK